MAELKQNWQTLQRVMLRPKRIRPVPQATLVLNTACGLKR